MLSVFVNSGVFSLLFLLQSLFFCSGFFSLFCSERLQLHSAHFAFVWEELISCSRYGRRSVNIRLVWDLNFLSFSRLNLFYWCWFFYLDFSFSACLGLFYLLWLLSLGGLLFDCGFRLLHNFCLLLSLISSFSCSLLISVCCLSLDSFWRGSFCLNFWLRCGLFLYLSCGLFSRSISCCVISDLSQKFVSKDVLLSQVHSLELVERNSLRVRKRTHAQ